MKTSRKIITILTFIIGLGIMLYPTVSNLYNQHFANKLIYNYDAAMAELTEEDYEEEWAKARAYNQALVDGEISDAFTDPETFRDENYESVLNPLGDGVMGYIEIPEINVNLPIYHYSTEEVLQTAVGHLPGSSLPIGGESTHSVLIAHRGLPSAELFTDLDKLEEGSHFYLTILNETLAYEVDKITTVESDETESLHVTEGEDYVTLVTCTPYGVNTHRLLVRGHRIEYTGKDDVDSSLLDIFRTSPTLLLRILSILAALEIVILIIRLIVRRKR